MSLRGGLIIIMLGVQVAFAQQKPNPDWVNQKYSMFIHWGLYSELGGVWNGQPVRTGYSEQIQSFASIPGEDYAAVAKEFNPGKWNAETVVKLAKAAGMRSIVFTSKHHDGFCMYRSKYTAYNIVDATPFKRDVMKELATACKKHGVKFAVYFSLIDWHFPGNKITSHNADAITREHHAFSMKQVEEIMTNYGPISEIWFDMGSLSGVQSKELYDLVTRLQPKCMVSGRLGNDRGDFAVMGDNAYPDYKIGVPWQTPASFFNETWSYRSWQERGDLDKKIEDKLHSLIKVVSRGGNYLLNIGPRGDGSVVEFERDVLLGIGKWLDKYGEAIYNTTANPLDHPAPWGDVTRKGENLYLFVDRVPVNREVVLNGLLGSVRKASLMENGVKLEMKQNDQSVFVKIPGEIHPDRGLVMIKLECAGNLRAIPGQLLETNALTTENAIPEYAYSSMDYYSSFRSTVGFTWHVKKRGRQLTPIVVYTAGDRDEVIRLTIDGVAHDVALKGGTPSALNGTPASVVYGHVYLYAPQADDFNGYGFGYKERVDVRKGKWQRQHDLKPGVAVKIPMGTRESVYVLHEITSDKACDVLVELGVADGVQVMLNGNNVLLRTYVGGVPKKNTIVKLHLQQGANQLVVKLHNRYGTEVAYWMNPNVKQEEYKLRLHSTRLTSGEIHDCSVKLSHPVNKNSDIGLRNLRIEFKQQ